MKAWQVWNRQEGRNAHRAGTPLIYNPYSEGNETHRCWEEGWRREHWERVKP